MSNTFQLLTTDEMSEIAEQTRSVEGQHFLPHLYGNAIQMALLKKNDVEPAPIYQDATDDSEWFYVPSDWSLRGIPNSVHKNCFIEIQYRNGELDVGYPADWGCCWVQENHEQDIIRYRILEN